MSSRWLVIVAVVLELAMLAAGRAADAKPLDPKQAYAKQFTWAETMIATRANCAEWAKDMKEGAVASTPLAAVWARIQADWPAHTAWFHEDLPGDRYLDWFLQANNNPHFERWILGRALSRVPAADASLSRELDELVRSNVPTSDPRWLELYARTRRVEELVAVGSRIWLGDLRCAIER